MNKKSVAAAHATLVLLVFMFSVVPANSWVYQNATAQDTKFEKFGPRANQLIIKLYPTPEAEWLALEKSEIDIADAPLTPAYVQKYSSPPWNQTINVVSYGTGSKAMSRRYTGSTPEEANYTGEIWDGVVNIDGVGIDNFWSFLDMHPSGYEAGDADASMTIRLGSTGNATSLNPLSADMWKTKCGLERALDSQYPRLCAMSDWEVEGGNLSDLVPWLAENFTVSQWQGGTKIRVALRPDATWTDGTPITLGDVYFTFVELKSLLLARSLSLPPWSNNVAHVLDLKLLDPCCFEILLDAANATAVPLILENIVLPRHVWKPILLTGDPTAFAPDPNMVSSGPWRLKEFSAEGNYVTMIANAPGGTVQTSLPSATPVTSPSGFWRIFPLAESLCIKDPPELCYRHRIPPELANSTTLHWELTNLYTTSPMDALIQANATIGGVEEPFIVNETTTLPPSEDPFFSLTWSPHASGSIDWDSGVHRRDTWPFGAKYTVDIHIWGSFSASVTISVDLNGIVVWSKTFGANPHFDFSFSVTIWLPFRCYRNCHRVVIDPFKLWATVNGDIAGSNLYDDIGFDTYPYKSDLPTPDIKVNILDVIVAARAFGATPGKPRWNLGVGDLNGDYQINIVDIFAIASRFGWVG